MTLSESRPGTSSEATSSRAAQYLRMSTEHQKYSTENQATVIAAYAEREALTIVRTYEDGAKSGLTFKGRAALEKLIDDAISVTRDFDHLLIFDVSRWGRFQDVDESAFYEFICKESGVTVHYCAEQFSNDGSITAALLKNLKRAMAAEYSRDLSVKVFAGQSSLARRGFHVGGAAGFGLRRLLMDGNNKPRFLLDFHQYKYLITDRVVLIPGPPKELATVRRIFKLFVHEKKSASSIARTLNEQGSVFSTGRRWSYQSIYGVLENEKYLGHNLYNRISQKLRTKRKPNPPETWVRKDNCFPAIVDKRIFAAANKLRQTRKEERANKEHMLACARDLFVREGKISEKLISASEDCPSPQTYRLHFGGLKPLYKLLGYRQNLGTPPAHKYTKEELLLHLREVLAEKGRLTREVLKTVPGPTPTTFDRHFGCLKAAYAIIGYKYVFHKPASPRGARGRFACLPESTRSQREWIRKILRRRHRELRRTRQLELKSRIKHAQDPE